MRAKGFPHDDANNKSVDWYTPAWIFDELGLAGVYSFFVKKGQVVDSLQQRLIKSYGENYLDKVNAQIDRRFGSILAEMDNALVADEETRKKAQSFILSGRGEDLERQKQAEFKSASEALANQERLNNLFKFPNKTLLDRLNDFVRERAFNHNSVNSRRGNRAEIARRLKAWWDWLPDDPANPQPHGQAPQGVTGPAFKTRSEYVAEFIDSYLEFALKQTGVKGSALWESFTRDRLRNKMVDANQYDLVNKLMTQLRASHFEA